jgi:predicted GNAT superfamily acetyltransferase
MNQVSIRNAKTSDFKRIVEINALEVVHTSPMDLARLIELNSYSSFHRVVEIKGVVAAFLLTMSANSEYKNDNYDWFGSRYESFIYIDRIVVNADYAGFKLGSLLYNDLFEFSKMQSIECVCCEYNLIPSNIPSQKFHDKFGFKEVGQQWLNNNTKKVSLQVASL